MDGKSVMVRIAKIYVCEAGRRATGRQSARWSHHQAGTAFKQAHVSIREALDAELEKRKEEATSELTIRIPSTMRGPLEAYGQREGLSDISEILRNAAMRSLRNEKLL